MTPEEQWAANHPNHCKKCKGWGIFTWTEYHDGPKYPGEPMMDSCDDCLAVGCCPWCLMPVMDNTNGRYNCNYCGWQEGDEGMPAPEEPDSGCWEAFDEEEVP